MPGGTGGGSFGVGVLVDETDLEVAAAESSRDPMSLLAARMLGTPPQVTRTSPFPDGASSLALQALEPPTVSVNVPAQPAVDEALLVSCLAHSLQTDAFGTPSLDAFEATPESAFLVDPPVRLLGDDEILLWEAGGAVLAELKVSLSPESDIDQATEGGGAYRSWVVCVIQSTERAAAEALVQRVTGMARPAVLPDDVAGLPGPVFGARYQRPLGVAFPVLGRAIRWPATADMLTRLPDAVWGTPEAGATDEAPAPGSAAELLGRNSRYLSSWGGVRGSGSADQPTSVPSGVSSAGNSLVGSDSDARRLRRVKSAPPAALRILTTTIVDNTSTVALDTQLRQALDAAQTYSESQSQPWQAPQIVVSGSQQVTLTCPLAEVATRNAQTGARVPCLAA